MIKFVRDDVWISPTEAAAGRPIIVTGHSTGSACPMHLLYSLQRYRREKKLDVLLP
jgi:hypothetical protein